MSEAFIPQGEAILTIDSDPYLATSVATLTNVEFSGSTNEVDYTNNDSPNNTSEFVAGLRDLGTVTADFVANTSNAEYLHDAWVAREEFAWTLLFWTSGFSKAGNGFISEFSINGELTGESVVEGSITIRITSES